MFNNWWHRVCIVAGNCLDMTWNVFLVCWTWPMANLDTDYIIEPASFINHKVLYKLLQQHLIWPGTLDRYSTIFTDITKTRLFKYI